MRQRFLFGAVLSAALAACGGSSSETPPPLQPDPTGFRYASAPPAPQAEERDAGEAPTTVDDATDDDKPRVPAKSTWGTPTPPH
jgi:hypothetical protein